MSRRSLTVIENLDLIVLAIALPIFIFAGFPLAGYLVAAALWLTSRFVHAFATRKVEENLLAGKRNTAMGAVAATSLGSAWMMSLGVLVAGIFSRDVGLSAAVLLVVLFTLNLATRGAVHLLKADEADQAA